MYSSLMRREVFERRMLLGAATVVSHEELRLMYYRLRTNLAFFKQVTTSGGNDLEKVGFVVPADG